MQYAIVSCPQLSFLSDGELPSGGRSFSKLSPVSKGRFQKRQFLLLNVQLWDLKGVLKITYN